MSRILYQHFKDRISRIQSENFSFDIAKVSQYFQAIIIKNGMFRLLFSPMWLLFSILFRCLPFRPIQGTYQLSDNVLSPQYFLWIFGVGKLPIGIPSHHLIIKCTECCTTWDVLYPQTVQIVHKRLRRLESPKAINYSIVDSHHDPGIVIQVANRFVLL